MKHLGPGQYAGIFAPFRMERKTGEDTDLSSGRIHFPSFFRQSGSGMFAGRLDFRFNAAGNSGREQLVRDRFPGSQW
jgi:hypothetical protein